MATRRYAYVEPGEQPNEAVTRVFTEEEILATYYPYWQSQMRKVHKEDLISPEMCLEDWCAVNWATEVDDDVRDGTIIKLSA